MKNTIKLSDREVKYFRAVVSPMLNYGVINAPQLEVKLTFGKFNFYLPSRLYKLRRQYKTAEAVILKSMKPARPKAYRANREVISC